MAEYRYLFADLRTNAILAELPLKGVSFSTVLNNAGSLSASLPIGDSRIQAQDPLGSTQPSRTALYVDRDGVLIWGGIIWTRRFSSENQSLDIGAASFWSYFKRRLITTTKHYNDYDQQMMASELLISAQGVAGGNIGVNVEFVLPSKLRDRSYYGYEYKPVAEAVEQLAAVNNGFDFAIDVAYNSAGVPTKTFRSFYPRRGRTVANTGLVFEYPGNVVSYAWPEDGAQQANSFYALGAGEGDAMLESYQARPDLIDVGYPLLQATKAFKDVNVRATLAAHAIAELNAVAYPITIPELSVRADQDPVLGSYLEGDDVRIRITDARHGALDVYERIVGYTVRPGDDSPEQVTLELGETA